MELKARAQTHRDDCDDDGDDGGSKHQEHQHKHETMKFNAVFYLSKRKISTVQCRALSFAN